MSFRELQHACSEEPIGTKRTTARGPVRGRIIRALAAEEVARSGVVVLETIVAQFNARYEPPTTKLNVSLAIKQRSHLPPARKLKRGVFIGAPGNKPVLPVVDAMNPTAALILRTLIIEYPRVVSTPDLIKLVPARIGKAINPNALYRALRFLDDNKLVRWSGGIVNVPMRNPVKSPLIGGIPTEFTIEGRELPPIDDTMGREYTDKFKEKRTADDDVIEVDDDGNIVGDYGPARS